MTGLYADRLPPMDEIAADAAFLEMSRLRDRLIARDEKLAALYVEDAIAALQRACRELTK